MRDILAWLICATIGTASAPGVGAQVTADENAALRYLRAYSLIRESDAERIAELWDAQQVGEPWLENDANTSWLERKDDTIALLVKASRMVEADFGIDYDEGIEALLTHLAPMRQSARLALLRGEADLDEGDARSAIEHAASALRMAEHITDDRVIISSLVSLSIFEEAAEFIERAHEDGALMNTDTSPLREALARFDRGDPFGVITSLESEAQIVGDWAHRELSSLSKPEREALVLNVVNTRPEDLSEEGRAFLERIETEDGLDREIASYKLYYRQTIDAWDEPDAEQRLRELREGVREGVFGAISYYMVPALGRLYRQDMEARARIRELAEMVGTG